MAPYQLLWTQPKPTILNQCCFKPVSESDSPSYSNLISTDCVDSFDCTPEEVSVYLKQIKSYTAPGPDGITAWMLSSLAEDVAPSVASIFNLSISSGRLPADWKWSNFVPIPKGPIKDYVHFYRPISLLPLVSKVLERYLHDLLLDFLSSKGLLCDEQFGVYKGRSTVIPLLLAVHQLHKVLESKHQVACVFFDYLNLKRSTQFHTSPSSTSCTIYMYRLYRCAGSRTTSLIAFKEYSLNGCYSWASSISYLHQQPSEVPSVIWL